MCLRITGLNVHGIVNKEIGKVLTFKRFRAFTLIELLVVIAIVALLVAVVAPSLGNAKQQARSAYCRNNMRQMVIAAHAYAFAYDDYYPPAYYTAKVGGIRYYYSWDFTTYKDWGTSPATEKVEPGLLWQGQTAENIQQCPSFKGSHNWLADPFTGYNYNTSYIGIDETVNPAGSARTTEVALSSQTAIFGDGQYSAGANKFMRAPFSNPRDASFDDPSRVAGTQGYRHLGKTNVAFCDGHVVAWDKLYTDTDPIGTEQLETYNAKKENEVKIGFLSPNNSAYDLK